MFQEEEKAENLWRWFYNNQNLIVASLEERDSSHDERIVAQLNELVVSFGKLGWEMRKGISKPWAFILKPNGDDKFLELTKDIISLAPQLEHWEFFASNPPRVWDRKFITYDDHLIAHKIDATAWHYASFDSDDNKINIIIEASNISHLDDDTAFKAAEFVVQQELGEELMIKSIGSIEVTDLLDDEDQEFKTHISKLNSDISRG